MSCTLVDSLLSPALLVLSTAFDMVNHILLKTSSLLGFQDTTGLPLTSPLWPFLLVSLLTATHLPDL